MTDDELKALEARANAAPASPWGEFERSPQTIFREYEIRMPGGGALFRSTSYGRMREDAEFIAHARTDIPALIHALREERQALRAALEEMKEHYSDCSGLDCGQAGDLNWCADQAVERVVELEKENTSMREQVEDLQKALHIWEKEFEFIGEHLGNCEGAANRGPCGAGCLNRRLERVREAVRKALAASTPQANEEGEE